MQLFRASNYILLLLFFYMYYFYTFAFIINTLLYFFLHFCKFTSLKIHYASFLMKEIGRNEEKVQTFMNNE